jgi:hypothetical protein
VSKEKSQKEDQEIKEVDIKPFTNTQELVEGINLKYDKAFSDT